MVRRAERGFTLPELLVVVAVAGILLAAGLPSMGEFVHAQRVKTASFDLYSSLVFARSEAITRNSTVKIEPISGYWTNGWTIKDASGNLLRELGAVPNINITLVPTSATYIEFRGSGRLKVVNPLDGKPQFELSSTGSTPQSRCITIDLSGRPTTATTVCP
jgi:type IV fimbrial biogenesis protein FimT